MKIAFRKHRDLRKLRDAPGEMMLLPPRSDRLANPYRETRRKGVGEVPAPQLPPP